MDTNRSARQDRPVLRITTFGAFLLWNATPSTGAWQQVNLSSLPKTLQGRGLAKAITVLKVLVCQPGRHASRAFLQETLWPDKTMAQAQERVEDNIAILRALFRTLGIDHPLIHTSRGTEGNGYRLEAYPVIWIDVDAFCYYVQAAARSQRLGGDPLPYWEKAYQLAKQGLFLADDLYSQWNQSQRRILQGDYRQCVLSLATVYRQRKATQEEILLLRTYVTDHPSDEDVLRPYLELLGSMECYQEASEYFERAEKAAKEEQRSIDAHTHDIYLHIQAQQIIRPPRACEPPESPHVIQSELVPIRESSCSHRSVLHSSIGRTEGTVWFRLKYDLVQNLVALWQGRALYCDELQAIVDQELHMADSLQWLFSPDELSHSRRTFLRTLVMSFVSPTLIKRVQTHPTVPLLEEFLPQIATAITTCQQLLRGNGLEVVEQALPLFLPTIEDLAKRPSSYQPIAASLTTQAYMLSAVVALHRHHIGACEYFYQCALLYSRYSQRPNLQVAVLKQTATRLLEDHKTERALSLYEQALPLIEDASQHIAPRLKGLIHIGMATAHAQKRDKQNAAIFLGKAQTHFFEPMQPETLSFIDTALYHYYLWKGLLHVEFRELEEAEQTFASIDSLHPIAERIRLEIVNQRARTAVIANEKEKAIQLLIDGATGAKNLQSEKRLQEVMTIVGEAQAIWPSEWDIRALSGLVS